MARKDLRNHIYWATVTMTTVGYGDIVPHTSLMQFLSVLLILVGQSLIIVPTGFDSAEIVLLHKVKSGAARLCQNCLCEGLEEEAKFCRSCGMEL